MNINNQCPPYRQSFFRIIREGQTQLGDVISDNVVSTTNCWYSVSHIEHEMNVDEKARSRHRCTIEEFERIKQYYPKSVFKEITWQFTKEELSRVLSGVKLELIRRLNYMIGEITYGKIPQGIFKKFQTKVNEKLTESNPEAISELNMAYESLGKSEDSERIAHVAFACRRLIKAVADKLFPAKNGEEHKFKNGTIKKIGEDNFLNRLEAYVDSVDSPNRKYIINEVDLLRDLFSEIPESLNKGVHLSITNSDAERLVLYSYMILGDVILEGIKLSNPI